MEDPELQIRGSGRWGLQKIFFGPQFGRKIRVGGEGGGGGVGAGPSHGSSTEGSLILKLALYRPAECDDIKQ